MKLLDPILYADMLNALRLGVTIVYEDAHALLLWDVKSEMFWCTADEVESARKMLEYLPDDFGILVSHDELCNEVMQEMKGVSYENRCYHGVYLKDEPLPIQLCEGYEIREVTPIYMEDVIALYKAEMPDLANTDYMGSCMQGGMYGVFDKDILCGFISVHEGGYGSIGMLEVKKEYQRKGFGIALERHMINVQLERGRIPYGEIFMENQASFALQKHVGMVIGENLTYWFYS